MTSGPPVVTLGLPVFNGERFVAEAIASLQAQSWPRIEILISDNASTDGTERICREAAKRDHRIRYIRQSINLGSSANFEVLAHESRGNLFAWCAHDDRRRPTFVEACVAELQRRPEAVLCNSRVEFLDERGDVLRDWPDRNFATWHSTRPERAQRLVDHVNWVDMYGLIRRDALIRCLPIPPIWGGDVILSMKLLMLGEFAKVEEPLFQYRAWTRPRSPEKVMADVSGQRRSIPWPYTEMIRALFQVPFEAAATEDERAEVLWRFLRILTEAEPDGAPKTCWRQILAEEHAAELGPAPSRPRFSRHLLSWLAEALPASPGETWPRAVELVHRGARRLLLAGTDAHGEAGQLAGMVELVRRALPNVEVAILWPEPGGTPAGIESGVRIFPYSPLEGEADPDLRRVRAWMPDLALCPFPLRTRRLDNLVIGTGAPITAAFSLPARRSGSRWFRRGQAYEPDRSWGDILPAGGGSVAVEHWLRTLRVPA